MGNEQAERLVKVVRTALGPRLLGAYLYGSAVVGGLRPASDLDLFVLTSRRTTSEQRHRLTIGLRPLSARDSRPQGWRPVELTICAQPDLVPWRYPPRMEFQSGEWLRREFDAGNPRPWRSPNPDLAIVIPQVRQSGRPLIGPPASELLPEVPRADLIRAMTDEIGSLLHDLDTDTANVLLTLARIWYTLETGSFAPKDVAAEWAIERLPASGRVALAHAGAVYKGHEMDAWDGAGAQVGAAASHLADEIRRVATIQQR